MSQGWSKIFNRINWLNRPSTNTPLNATNLNAGDSAIDKLDDRIITLDTVKADMQVVNGMVADVLLNESNGVITITYKNGSTKTYDTNLEKIATNFTYDYSTQRLVLTLSDGSKQYVDMSALITQYEFKDSTTIAFSVDSTGKISASVKNGSITDAMLETGYLANIKVEVAKAEAAATQAKSSEASSDYNAKLSRSYAIGGSGIREGEDTDNAMYYYEQAKKTDIGQISSEVAELNSNLDGLENDCLTLQNTPLKKGVYTGDTGDFFAFDNYKCSEYHEITPNTPIKLELNTDNDDWGLLFYDENKTYLGRSNSVLVTSGKSIETTTPPNAKYATFNIHIYNGNFPIPKLYTTKIGRVVSSINESLGGLSFSISGTTLSITDGTNTWTLSN